MTGRTALTALLSLARPSITGPSMIHPSTIELRAQR